MQLKFKQLHEDAVLPRHSKNGDAGLDLTVVKITGGIDHLGRRIDTHYYGLSVEIPEGHVGLMFPRSSIFRTSNILTNSVGVIDSGYRGELMAVFRVKDSGSSYNEGERSAQLVVVPYCHCNTEWSEELSETERGVNGYGSTGK